MGLRMVIIILLQRTKLLIMINMLTKDHVVMATIVNILKMINDDIR